MSVAGLSASSLFNSSAQSQFQEFNQEFQELGKDLQAGNLSAAQSDFATLQQLGPQTQSTFPAQTNDPIAQAFEQLSQDLQAGNTSAAQQDFATIQQDFQNLASQGQTQVAPHHHHHGSGSEITQLLSQLGQALQSGNLSTAQQVYNTLQQDFEQKQTTSQSGSTSAGVSVSA
jgi:outer membrane protein assembly factor BamD (BamD/ComL family)